MKFIHAQSMVPKSHSSVVCTEMGYVSDVIRAVSQSISFKSLVNDLQVAERQRDPRNLLVRYSIVSARIFLRF